MAAYWAWVEEVLDEEEHSDWLITQLAANQAASLAPMPIMSLAQLQRAVRKIADQFSSLASYSSPLLHIITADSLNYRVLSTAVNGACLCTGLSFQLVQSMLSPNFQATQGTLMLSGLDLRSTPLKD